ncbi:MAG: hypothetical protein ACI9VR_003342 [Cognaticolwellia sp.]|jgi:hypothetical protein
MIHHLLAPDVDSLRAFAQGTGQELSVSPQDGAFLAHPPGDRLPRIAPTDEAIALLPAGPLTLRSAEQIEHADRVLCLPGATPGLAKALTAAPVMGLQAWQDACPRGLHHRSMATWERVLRGEQVAGAQRFASQRPVDLQMLSGLDSEGPRSKGQRLVGLCWSLREPSAVLRVSICGGEIQAGRAGTWWVDTKHSHWPQDVAHLARIQAQWSPDFGDRRSEWVAIGGTFDLDSILVKGGCLQEWSGAAMVPGPPF